MTVLTIKNNIKVLLNAIKTKKQYLIIPYNKIYYTIIQALKFSFIKKIYKIQSYIILYFKHTYNKNTFIKVKFIDVKNKKNYYTVGKLKKISYLYGIISTSKGFFLISEAIKLNEGGVLVCIFKFN